MPTAALLSNFKSINLGNEALTAEVVREVRAAYGDGNFTGFHRLPEALNTQLRARSASSWARAVDEWVERVGASPVARPEGGLDAMEYALSRAAVLGRPDSARRKAATLVGRLPFVRTLRATRAGDTVARQLGQETAHDHVIYVPAGEINIAGEPLTRFLEVAVAQRLGRRTALVNFSYEPNARVSAVAQHVLPQCDLILARDERSVARLVADGAGPDAIRIVPDAVIGVSTPRREPVNDIKRVGVAINATLDSASRPTWVATIRSLIAAGIEVTLLSNEHGRDAIALSALATETGALMPEHETSYLDYAHRLAELDLVVSTRFHTLVLALASGVHVVPVEGTSDRIRGGLDVFGLPDAVVDARPSARDFGAAVLKAVDDGGATLTAAEVEELARTVRSAYDNLPRNLS